MEWDEALLRARGGEISPQWASYYRRKAARARQIAEGATTRAMRARLLDEAVHGDQLITDKDGCSDATLKGDYAFAVTNLTTQNFVVGIARFDGKGNLTQIDYPGFP